MISNSLNIDFINGDIHGRSSKNTMDDINQHEGEWYENCVSIRLHIYHLHAKRVKRI